MGTKKLKTISVVGGIVGVSFIAGFQTSLYVLARHFVNYEVASEEERANNKFDSVRVLHKKFNRDNL